MKTDEVKVPFKVMVYCRIGRPENEDEYLTKEEKQRKEITKLLNKRIRNLYNQKIPNLLDRRIDKNGIF